MSASQIPIGALGTTMFNETAQGAAASAVKASGGTIYAIEVDNTVNAAAIAYLKLYFAASGGVVVGTTDPDMIIPIPANTKKDIIPPGGLAFGTALTIAVVNSKGTPGTTAMGTPPPLSIIYA